MRRHPYCLHIEFAVTVTASISSGTATSEWYITKPNSIVRLWYQANYCHQHNIQGPEGFTLVNIPKVGAYGRTLDPILYI